MRSRPGFTLLEVTLSATLLIVFLYSAVLLYDHARNEASFSRARTRVAALQGVVEGLISKSAGNVPPPATVLPAWVQARPDDYALSPFGGEADTNTDRPPTVVAPGFIGWPVSTTGKYWAQTFTDGRKGCMEYDIVGPGATCSFYDLAASSPSVPFRSYVLYAYDQNAERSYFVTGGQ